MSLVTTLCLSVLATSILLTAVSLIIAIGNNFKSGRSFYAD